LATVDLPTLTKAEAERRYIFSLLVLTLIDRYFNGNKYGAFGLYPSRVAQRLDPSAEGGPFRGTPRQGDPSKGCDFDYLGHNIACIAVDAKNEVIDFDFNHNEVLDSSVEHAESRLIRRVFSLTRIYDGWRVGTPQREDYGNLLKDVTVYTSLESCAQCAGIMALGQVKEVVYLQRDPGMYAIGNILYNFTHLDKEPKLPAPLPRSADTFGFRYFDELNAGLEEHLRRETKEGVWFFKASKEAKARGSNSVTSFLCTDTAADIFRRARQEFQGFTVSEAENASVVAHARRFFEYASVWGERGTPHKL
jgi:tRNA(Arg) A34 adenosine deaminase TadA